MSTNGVSGEGGERWAGPSSCPGRYTDYLIFIDAERTLLANQLSLAQAMNSHVGASIQLVKALGGGWNPSEDSRPR